MDLISGCGLAVLAGVMQGTFPLPMKYTKKWEWENTWSVFAFWGFVVLPWLLAFLTVPRLIEVYTSVSYRALASMTFFGLGWGVGTICFGIGVSTVGLALGFAIIIGLTGALGTLIPMIVFHLDAFQTTGGLAIVGGVALMLIGIGLCAFAGNRKQQALAAAGQQENAAEGARSFRKGLAFCLISGIASPMLNFAFVFADEVVLQAKAAGTASAHASNPVWCWVMTSAFVVTLIYCLGLMRKDKGWSRYVFKGTSSYWLLTSMMGFLWSASIAMYGIALSMLGPLAPSVGWPILMITTIIAGNVWGIATGEWRGVGRRPLGTMVLGLIVLSSAVCVVATANR